MLETPKRLSPQATNWSWSKEESARKGDQGTLPKCPLTFNTVARRLHLFLFRRAVEFFAAAQDDSGDERGPAGLVAGAAAAAGFAVEIFVEEKQILPVRVNGKTILVAMTGADALGVGGEKVDHSCAEIVGHLLDSAANNRQRFVRAATAEVRHYAGPKYAQEAWVKAHGYSDQNWETLLDWWRTEHAILAAVVDRIPKDRLGVECVVGDNAPVTLRFLIEDYIAHQQWHFAQLMVGVQQG